MENYKETNQGKFKKSWKMDKHFENCKSSEHYPPTHMVYEAGEHKHRCPMCGYITTFIVPKVTC